MLQRALTALALLTAISCSGGDTAIETTGPKPTPPANDTRDMLIVGQQSDIGYLVGPVYETQADSLVLQAINMPTIDNNFDCSLKKTPGLAKDWEWSADGTVITMNLRDDIKWSDGKPVTAHDIAFTYELIGDPMVASPRFNYLENMKADGNPKVINDYKLEWHFTHAYDRDTMMSHTSSISAVPKHIFESADRATIRGHDFNKNPLANGPWKLALYEPNQRFVLEPNENFTGPAEKRPKLNRVVFRILPEYSARLLELKKGTIDFMGQVSIADADNLAEEHPNIRLVRRGYRGMDFVVWNLKNPLFEDIKVRTALAKATDVEGMMDKLLTSKTGERYAQRALSTLTPELCGVYNDEIPPINFNIEEAKKLMAEAGWADTNGDGILDKDGKPFSFTLGTNTGNKRRADAQIFIQDQLKQIGVQVNLEQLETNTFYQRLRKRDYEAALGGWQSALFVDPRNVWHSDSPGAPREFNFAGYANPEVDEIMAKALATPELKDAAPLWKEMQAKIYADQPYLFLWWTDEIVAIDKRFENTEIEVLSELMNLHKWSVPADKVKYKQ
jgi:peptide/nickel transport system substrate-binding protein